MAVSNSNIIAQLPSKLAPLLQPKRYKVLWGGRGAGRSWNVARVLLILGAERKLRVLCAREFQNSIRESVHKVLSDQIDYLQLQGRYIVEQNRIFCPSSGTEFSFEGIRNNVNRIKSYEGIDVCWVEEANKVSKGSWEVLIPTIRKESSEIWVTFNPELETDDTYQRFIKNQTDEMWVCKLSWRDNPWFPQVLMTEMLALKARDMDAYLNVWEGECRVLLDGAVYGEQLRDVMLEGRIKDVPWERSVSVDTFWDLGRADATAIWFGQFVGFEYRLLQYYENSQKDLDHYINYVQRQSYVYGTTWLPHDAKPKRLGSKLTVLEQCQEKLGHRVRLAPNFLIKDGIAAARTIFPNCWFDSKKTEQGLHALRNYKYEVSDDGLSKEPVHDWASHGADAFRYFAVSAKGPRRGRSDPFTEELAQIKDKAVGFAERMGEQVRNSLGWLG